MGKYLQHIALIGLLAGFLHPLDAQITLYSARCLRHWQTLDSLILPGNLQEACRLDTFTEFDKTLPKTGGDTLPGYCEEFRYRHLGDRILSHLEDTAISYKYCRFFYARFHVYFGEDPGEGMAFIQHQLLRKHIDFLLRYSLSNPDALFVPGGFDALHLEQITGDTLMQTSRDSVTRYHRVEILTAYDSIVMQFFSTHKNLGNNTGLFTFYKKYLIWRSRYPRWVREIPESRRNHSIPR
jgi:hypothetical protein